MNKEHRSRNNRHHVREDANKHDRKTQNVNTYPDRRLACPDFRFGKHLKRLFA